MAGTNVRPYIIAKSAIHDGINCCANQRWHMSINRVVFSEQFLNRHGYFQQRDPNDAKAPKQTMELYDHAKDVERLRHGRSKHLPSDLDRQFFKRNIGSNTPSTTIAFDELETRNLIESSLIEQLRISKMSASAGDFLSFTVHLPNSQAFHANKLQGDTNSPKIETGIYARVGGVVERSASSRDLILSINHFDGLMHNDELGVINNGPNIDFSGLT